jgi:hypothetical protein
LTFLNDPYHQRLTTLRVKNLQLKWVLMSLLHYNDMMYIFQNNRILIKFRKTEFEEDKIAIVANKKEDQNDNDKIKIKLKTFLIARNFEGITLSEAIYQIGKLADINIFIDPYIILYNPPLNDSDVDLILEKRPLPLEAVLNILIAWRTRSYIIENGLLIIL